VKATTLLYKDAIEKSCYPGADYRKVIEFCVFWTIWRLTDWFTRKSLVAFSILLNIKLIEIICANLFGYKKNDNMKRIGIAFAALALIFMSCDKEDLTVEPAPRTVTVTASIASPDDDVHTRYTLTPTDPTGGTLTHGLEFKFEATDWIRFWFEWGSTVKVSLNVTPNSISPDGKTAQFTITIPEEIPDGATFNLYVGYGNAYSGRYGEASLSMGSWEEQYVDLEGEHKIRPMLYHSQKGIVNSEAPVINNINLQHTGWIMAFHYKNSSDVEINYPYWLRFTSADATAWTWNGGNNPAYEKFFDLSTGTHDNDKGNELTFNIQENYFSSRLAPGATRTFYRWVTSELNVPELVITDIDAGGYPRPLPSNIRARTVENGKIYHLYVEWDGTNLEFVDPF